MTVTFKFEHVLETLSGSQGSPVSYFGWFGVGGQDLYANKQDFILKRMSVI